jgi:hypothetical protein
MKTSDQMIVNVDSVSDVSHTLSKRHCYRIGLIGSTASGKTCLLAALNMQMIAHPRGYHSVMSALNGDEGESLKKGHQWIEDACTSLKEGHWPKPNYNAYKDQRYSVRFHFSDGATRQKSVELFDYSGELLDPSASQSELAVHLRGLLREMDALIMLAEIPMRGQDSIELNNTLHGLLRVFALIVEQRKEPTRQIPIVLCVNKWDRTGHLNAEATPESQNQLLESFLASVPPPFHQNILNALRPAVGDGRLKAFPVSACSPRSVDSGELPPENGQLCSFGVQDPFLWVIEQRDDIDLIESRERLDALSKKRLAAPWSPWRELRILNSRRNRFEKRTPEGSRLVSLVRDAQWLIARQILLYFAMISVLLLVGEAGWDKREHRTALSNIKLPTLDHGWQQGTDWLRKYGQSPLGRHFVYDQIFLKKQEALELAYQVEQEKDNELLANVKKAEDAGNLEEAKRLVEEHKLHYPNSSNKAEVDQLLAGVEELERNLAFEKLLHRWGSEVIALQPATDDAERDTKGKILKLSTLLREVRDAKGVPLAGKLRTNWTVLVGKIDDTSVKLAARLSASDLIGKIKQRIDGGDYLGAADLLAGPEFRKEPDNKVLRNFQSTLAQHVQEKCATLSKQGETWRSAVAYAEKFLEPNRRIVVSDSAQQEINSIISNTKQKCDQHIYELAKKNLDDPALDFYLSDAPLQSMAEEVRVYRKWLGDRDQPRTLTFRLVSIAWSPSVARTSWRGTAIEMSVNKIIDKRNSTPDDNLRSGITDNKDGIRVVILDNVAQTKDVEVLTQFWHVPLLVGGWELKGKKDFQIKPENLTKEDFFFIDKENNKIKIHVDGVIPEPILPRWHPSE